MTKLANGMSKAEANAKHEKEATGKLVNHINKKTDSKTASIRLNRHSGEFLLTAQVDEQSIIDAAKQAIGRQFKRQSFILDDIDKVKDFLLLNLAPNEREVFACMFLDCRSRLIS